MSNVPNFMHTVQTNKLKKNPVINYKFNMHLFSLDFIYKYILKILLFLYFSLIDLIKISKVYFFYNF